MNHCPECKKPKYVKCCHNCKNDAGKCEVYHACGDDCPEWVDGIKTNADCMGAMSDDEKASWIIDITINDMRPWCNFHCETDGKYGCKKCVLKWLQQPAEE